MGNQSNKSTKYISSSIYHQSKRLENEYYQFINNEDQININHINGGVSSGISNSETYISKNGFKIDIWKDINFIKLLRGRKELIQEWVNQFNENKPDNISIAEFYQKIETFKFNNCEQRQAYIRKYLPIEEDLKIEDLQEINKIPNNITWKKINSYLIDKITTLAAKHGYRDIELDRQIYFLKKILLENKARCTSGLHTFLKVLKQENTNYINICQEDKDFLVSISLSTTDPKEQKNYDIKREKITNSLKEEIDNQLKFENNPYIKTGTTILFGSDILNMKNMKYEIPEGLLEKYQIGDMIKISRQDLDFDNRLNLNFLEADLVDKEMEDVKKPIKIRNKYYLSFNSNDQESIDSFIEESIQKFTDDATLFFKSRISTV